MALLLPCKQITGVRFLLPALMNGELTIEVLDTNNEFQEYLGAINQSIYDGFAIPSEVYRASFSEPVTVHSGEQLAIRLALVLDGFGLSSIDTESVTLVGNNKVWSLYKEDKVNWKHEGF